VIQAAHLETALIENCEDANTFHFSVPPMPTDQELLPDDDMRGFWEGHTLAQLFSGIAGEVALTIAANT